MEDTEFAGVTWDYSSYICSIFSYIITNVDSAET